MDRDILEQARERFKELVVQHNLADTESKVLVKNLTPEEAIGLPGRRDFPIVLGKERVVEAEFARSKAHVFTDSPKEFIGKLADVVDLSIESSDNRAIFVGVMNAVLRHLGKLEKTLHCRDEEPEQCAKEIAAFLKCKYHEGVVGLIGLNPAIAEALTQAFGADKVKITDLNPANIGKQKFGVEVWDGRTRTEDLVKASDIVTLTGTTLVNNTFDRIISEIKRYGKEYVVYGVTCGGVSALMGINRICPYGRT
jgi:uncharacterized protein (DUF4213/DUF364 family)